MNGTILSIRNDSYRVERVREAFFSFMQEIKPGVKKRTISTYCSDAFFILDNLPDTWLDELVTADESRDVELKKKLHDVIRQDITATRSHPETDARSYLHTFWYLIRFLRMLSVVESGRMPRRIGG